MAVKKGTKMQQVIQLNPKAKPNFRQGTARALYYAVFAAHNGKPLSQCVKALQANPPSVPKRGKLKGKAEPVQGWVSYFIRGGYINLVNRKPS